MNKSVTIVDYGVGNLRSVTRAFEQIGAKPIVTSNATIIQKSERLVLPGVGAFGHCMQELEKRNLTELLKNFAGSAKPFLGICVGMQIMLTVGEEFGEHQGLNLIAGRVKSIPPIGKNGKKHILPSIGWQALHKPPNTNWQGTILENMKESEQMYFVHSFAAYPDNQQNLLAVYDYETLQIPAAIIKDNIVGVQFHPEKSASAGLKIVEQFLRL
jgi:glutamine amidotransferase